MLSEIKGKWEVSEHVTQKSQNLPDDLFRSTFVMNEFLTLVAFMFLFIVMYNS